MANSQSIGVLDSGVGGLTVLKELHALLPNESFIYLGDSGRAPYGPRPVEEIQAYTEEMIDLLISKGVKTVVLACNTITVNCLNALQMKYNIPIIGMNFATQEVDQASKKRSIAILGTAATIAAKKHEDALKEAAPDIRIYPIACYDFCPLVEAGHIGDEKAAAAIAQYLAPIRGDIDVALLACTHYPFLTKDIQAFLGDTATLIDPSYLTALDTKNVLEAHELLSEATEKGSISLHFSGDSSLVTPLVKLALNKKLPINPVQWK